MFLCITKSSWGNIVICVNKCRNNLCAEKKEHNRYGKKKTCSSFVEPAGRQKLLTTWTQNLSFSKSPWNKRKSSKQTDFMSTCCVISMSSKKLSNFSLYWWWSRLLCPRTLSCGWHFYEKWRHFYEKRKPLLKATVS